MKMPGFDNKKYIALQSEQIKKRIGEFGGKLYLEFGGKLFDDYHASRVLPGFEPDSKIRMLSELKDEAEIVIAINAADIEKNKIRGDLGITYDLDVLRLIDAFRSFDLYVGSVVMTRYNGQASADAFQKRLESLGIPVYRHYPIEGYPSDIEKIVSEDGLGRNDYIKTSRSLIVITAPGPGSGKMATCLSQMYHDNKRGISSGYAKFETFPIWNLPLKHPVNLAYEAATADLDDVNMIDPFHLEAYNQITVNYNRDIEIFPVLSAILKRINGSSIYHSPTDMGVNMAGYCIYDDEAVKEASRQEIIRRYYKALAAEKKGMSDGAEGKKLELLMNASGISPTERACVKAALHIAKETGEPAAAIELNDGRIVTGKTSSLLGALSAMLLNALKVLGGIDDKVDLISPYVIEPLGDLKVNHLGSQNPRLHIDEVLIALAICAAQDPNAKTALAQLDKLKGCQVHSSVIISSQDEDTFKRLSVDVTCEAVYQTEKLYHK